MSKLSDEVARIVSAPVSGCTLHTFNFNGVIAKTTEGDDHFLTPREVSDLLRARAAEAAVAIIKADGQTVNEK